MFFFVLWFKRLIFKAGLCNRFRLLHLILTQQHFDSIQRIVYHFKLIPFVDIIYYKVIFYACNEIKIHQRTIQIYHHHALRKFNTDIDIKVHYKLFSGYHNSHSQKDVFVIIMSKWTYLFPFNVQLLNELLFSDLNQVSFIVILIIIGL